MRDRFLLPVACSSSPSSASTVDLARRRDVRDVVEAVSAASSPSADRLAGGEVARLKPASDDGARDDPAPEADGLRTADELRERDVG